MDGNGRVARLAMNALMLQKKYLPIDIPPDKRDAYMQSIRNAYSRDAHFYNFMITQALNTHQRMLSAMEEGQRPIQSSTGGESF
jgi:Fic family protein